MRRNVRNGLLLTLMILLSNPSPIYAAENVEACKIQSPNLSSHIRVGWPVDKDSLNSKGVSNFLVLVVDFKDNPQANLNVASIHKQMELENVGNYFRSVSNQVFNPKFTIYPKFVRMPESSKHYGDQLEVDEIVDGEWESHHMTHDAIEVVSKALKISDFDAAIVVVSGGSSLSGRVALATSQDADLDIHESGEIHNTILAGVAAFSVEGVRPWMMLAHEINHLMGSADLYLYESEGWWQGKSVGPFGMQGYLRGRSATDSIGWNRWLRGWISDSRVLCVDSVKNLTNIKLSPPGSIDSNYEMIIVKKNKTEVIVIEAPRSKGFFASTVQNSLLVYQVNVNIEPGFGPVTIIPKRTTTTSAPLSPNLPDWDRFQEAPLAPGDQVLHQGVLFRNVNYANGALTFSLFTGSSALTQMNIQPTQIICRVGKKSLIYKGYSPSCPKRVQ